MLAKLVEAVQVKNSALPSPRSKSSDVEAASILRTVRIPPECDHEINQKGAPCYCYPGKSQHRCHRPPSGERGWKLRSHVLFQQIRRKDGL